MPGGRTATVRRGIYKDWDACWLENGPLALALVPQVGGRIMGLCWHDEELAFVNGALAGRIDDVAAIEDVRGAKRERGFVLWGGDKTWLAPHVKVRSGRYRPTLGSSSMSG